MAQRPDIFTLNESHHLANGLVFAGLGAHAGSTRYHDSSAYGNTGTLVGLDSTDQYFDNTLGRNVINLDGEGLTDCLYIPRALLPSAAITLTAWKYSNANANVFFGRSPDIRALVSGGSLYFKCDSLSDTTVLTGGTVSSAAWNHVAYVYDGTTQAAYLGGVLVASRANSGTLTALNEFLNIGSSQGYVYGTGGIYADPLIYNRALALPEIQKLADPSNVMLSGLINLPRRKWWPVVSGAAVFKPYWANQATQVAM